MKLVKTKMLPGHLALQHLVSLFGLCSFLQLAIIKVFEKKGEATVDVKKKLLCIENFHILIDLILK